MNAEEKINTQLAVKDVIAEANAAGHAAAAACIPNPMYVASEAGRVIDYVSEGPCGFAEIRFSANTPRNKEFLSAMKRTGFAAKKKSCYSSSADSFEFSSSVMGGYYRWVFEFNQSMARKEAFAHAYAKVLQSYGIECYASSRMD